MAQFNIVKGDSSRISTEITPFQDGRFYLTNDGGLYVDTVVDGENKRIHLNPTTGGGSMSYARTFVTGDWTAGASESTLSIPASDHGLTGDIIDCQAFSLHYGAHVTNTWAAVQTYATNESDGSRNIILRMIFQYLDCFFTCHGHNNRHLPFPLNCSAGSRHATPM